LPVNNLAGKVIQGTIVSVFQTVSSETTTAGRTLSIAVIK